MIGILLIIVGAASLGYSLVVALAWPRGGKWLVASYFAACGLGLIYGARNYL